jgi:hypothetical protein
MIVSYVLDPLGDADVVLLTRGTSLEPADRLRLSGEGSPYQGRSIYAEHIRAQPVVQGESALAPPATP